MKRTILVGILGAVLSTNPVAAEGFRSDIAMRQVMEALRIDTLMDVEIGQSIPFSAFSFCWKEGVLHAVGLNSVHVQQDGTRPGQVRLTRIDETRVDVDFEDTGDQARDFQAIVQSAECRFFAPRTNDPADLLLVRQIAGSESISAVIENVFE